VFPSNTVVQPLHQKYQIREQKSHTNNQVRVKGQNELYKLQQDTYPAMMIKTINTFVTASTMFTIFAHLYQYKKIQYKSIFRLTA
jgi:hypothetical protein